MLGLAILLGFVIWCGITLAATIFGYKLGKNFHYPKTGAFVGFMLLMGGWIVYWAIEFMYIQAKVTKLCEKEAGITVYVTPEEWRKQIGEEKWANLKPLTDKEINERYAVNKTTTFFFENKQYKYTKGQIRTGNIENSRITYYDFYGKINSIHMMSHILVDKTTKNVLLKKNEFSYSKKLMGIHLSSMECPNNISKNFHDIAVNYSSHN